MSSICPSCQAAVPAGFKFCGACGSPLAKKCPNCQVEIPPGFKFCGACGTALATEPAPVTAAPVAPAVTGWHPALPGQERKSDERKIVTVLFADIRGFTALSEKMDPEEVRDTIQSLFERLTRSITRFGGTVDKYIGDCIMALFGAPVAHENDPERAIRAGLAMQQEFLAFRDERKLDVGLRIGINTGMVLAGYLGERSGDYTVMGDEVNLASRLEQAAPVNGILVSQRTYSSAASLFEFEEIEPIRVKGKTEPVRCHRVLRPLETGAGTNAVRGRRIATRMVGRDAEMALMLKAAREAFTGQRQMILVTAGAGIGKSRLLYEYHQALMESAGRCRDGTRPCRVLKARALPYEADIPYYLFGSLIKNHCGITDNDSAAAAREKLLTGISAALTRDAGDRAAEITHFIGALINIDFPDSPHVTPLHNDPVQLNQRARQAMLDFFRSVTEQPTVIFLEDLHWAEQSSMDLATDLFRDSAGKPLLIVGVARPEFHEKHAGVERRFNPLTGIVLELLPEDAVREQVRELLKKVERIPDCFYNLVIEKSAGNPYYVEEIIRMFLDTGVIDKGDTGEVWQILEERLGEVEIPDTIQGLLQARLDNLTVNDKGVLQRASVVGRTFWRGAIDALLDDLTIKHCDPILRELAKKELIFDTGNPAGPGANPTGSGARGSFIGDEYIFKHALLRDVTYETILKKTRCRYHATVAQWIDQNGGDRKDEFLSLIALHYERGGMPAEAGAYYYLAGEQARMMFANREALLYFDKVNALSEKPQFRYIRRRGMVLEVLGEYQRARADYETLEKISDKPVDRGVALKHLAEINIRLGNYDRAAEFARQAMAIGETEKDGRMIAETLNLLGRIHDFRGETADALEFYTRSREAHGAAGNPAGEAIGLGNIGIIHMYRGEYDRAIAAYKAALEIDRQEKNKRRMTMMLSNLGESYQFLGALEEAVAYHREALTLARSIGFKLMQVEISRNLGIESVYLGRTDEGLALLRESLTFAEELGDMEMLPQVIYSLGDGLVIAGKTESALALTARLLKLAGEHGVKDYVAKAILLESRCRGPKACRDKLCQGLMIAEELQSQALLWDFHSALAAAAETMDEERRHLEKAFTKIGAALASIQDPRLRETFAGSRVIKPILERCRSMNITNGDKPS